MNKELIKARIEELEKEIAVEKDEAAKAKLETAKARLLERLS